MQTLQSLPISLQTVLLLMASNVFMTFAWYGHLMLIASWRFFVSSLVLLCFVVF